MLKRGALLLAILGGIAACGSSGAHDSASSSPPSPADNPSCATLGILAVPYVPPTCQYVAVDSNAVSAICNEPNSVTTIHTDCYADPTPSYCATCALNPNLQGSWEPISLSAKRLTADFDCKGVFSGYATVWQCQQQTMTVFFADDSNRTFSSTAAAETDPNNHARPLELDDCDPPSMDTTLPSADGSTASLTLNIPSHVFVPGSRQLQQANATSNPNAVNLSLQLSWRGVEFPAGVITGGTIDFAATTFDPNQRLAFTIDADMAPPTSDAQNGVYAVYCGQPGESSYGSWLGFVPSGT